MLPSIVVVLVVILHSWELYVVVLKTLVHDLGCFYNNFCHLSLISSIMTLLVSLNQYQM